jgi:acetolactate synthase I/II/III large subunit
MPRLTTAEATVETLLNHGLDTVYALPGLHNDPLFDAFYHTADRLRVIHPRHTSRPRPIWRWVPRGDEQSL